MDLKPTEKSSYEELKVNVWQYFHYTKLAGCALNKASKSSPSPAYPCMRARACARAHTHTHTHTHTKRTSDGSEVHLYRKWTLGHLMSGRGSRPSFSWSHFSCREHKPLRLSEGGFCVRRTEAISASQDGDCSELDSLGAAPGEPGVAFSSGAPGAERGSWLCRLPSLPLPVSPCRQGFSLARSLLAAP